MVFSFPSSHLDKKLVIYFNEYTTQLNLLTTIFYFRATIKLCLKAFVKIFSFKRLFLLGE